FNDSIAARSQDIGCPGGNQEFDDGCPSCTNTRYYDAHVTNIFVDHLQSVDQRSLSDNCGAVLIIVKHWYIQFLAQSCCDFKTARSRNVFEVNTAIGRGDCVADDE